MLLLPNLINYFNLENENLKKETKTVKKLPKFNFHEASNSIKEYTDYYSATFGGKATLLNQYALNKRLFFNESAKPKNAIIGKNGWYFLGDRYNYAFNGTFGKNSLTTQQLIKISDRLKKTITYLESKNIDFYFVVPPNKHTIYKEYLPYNRKEHITNFDLLKTHLKKSINLEIIDFREVFLSKKNEEDLYLKVDSHWNEYGAYLGYVEFMNHFNKSSFKADVIPINHYSIKKIKKNDNNDIAKMINYTPETTYIDLEYILNSHIEVAPNSTRNNLKFTNSAKKMKIMMHRDSYANAWMEFFNETFGECIYLRGYNINKSLIEKENPNAVIFEIIERNLINLSK